LFADTDILIVGSGPAGSVTARYAAESGLKVTMIEQRPEVGVPVRCGELVPSVEEIQGMFPNLTDAEELFEVPSELRRREIEGIRLVDPKDRRYEFPFTGYTTDRDRFDQHLARKAVDAGAELITSCRFMDAADSVAKTNMGDISYKIIIGADGPGSRTAKALGLPANRHPYPAVTSQADGDFEPLVQMFFGGSAPGAYGWIIPKDTEANVGVGFSPKFAHGKLSDYMDKFVAQHNLVPTRKLEGKFVPSEGPIARTYTENGMLVGDSAGFVISVNGGGIPLAMIGGRICAEAAVERIRNGTTLDHYQAAWDNVLGKPLRIAAKNKKLADTFAFHSDWTTGLCMRILGQKHMSNLIRCKHLYFGN
jgi:digeranylgeranylglycerophospholipid reductase